MRKNLQRGLCIVLCIVMACSFAVVPAGAVVISPVIGAVAKVCGAVVVAWITESALEEGLQRLKDFKDGKTADTDGLIVPISALDSSATRTKLTHEYLLELAYDWNKTCSDAVGFTTDVIEYHANDGHVYGVIVARVNRNIASKYLADGTGRILYCDLTEDTSGRWESPDDAMSTRYLLSYIDLHNLANKVGGTLITNGDYREICNRDGDIYCNPAGYRFSCIYESDKMAVNQDRETTVNNSTVTNNNTTQNITNDNSITNNDYSQDIDIENMQQALPGGIINNIDNLIYDDNTKTYYVDSHDVTNNITQNYLYEYHINYTSITYIGQTEEYNKRYELYYQLPDGRDSADLTLEELEQLNVDIDVIPYVRYTDNMDIRSLYHFDGDTRDSSYWNYATAFEWITGASLTYMESGAFEGALYLDELAHEFAITLPNTNDTVGDWTLQWRYYQSHTAAPVEDSAVYVGTEPVMKLDGKYLYTAAGDQITAVSVGSWNEICIIRFGGLLYYYVNGVYYTSCSDPSNRFGTVRFQFGDQQQTYKHFDELRFMRGAAYTPGENYTPTSVPHDTNLSLLLPSGTDVVVDEVSVLKPGSNNLLTQYDRDDWRKSNCGPNYFEGNVSPYYPLSEYMVDPIGNLVYSPVYTSGYPMIFDTDYVSGSIRKGLGREINFRGSSFVRDYTSYEDYRQPHNAFSLPLIGYEFPSSPLSQIYHYPYGSMLFGDWQPDTVYTYSVVLADHSYSSITFRIVQTLNDYNEPDEYDVEVLNISHNSEIQFSLEYLGQVWRPDNYSTCRPVKALCWNSVDGSAIVQYTELVVGDRPEFEIEYESAVYTSGELQHSPTLAVRTDIPLSDYQIGGVRPSVPQKGQVWALVESGYITSLQIYTGSVWENCDGRIWTGSRWIPASSYNVITLQDMFDIVDSTQDYEYIYTESGFWSWFQKAWKDLISRLDQIIDRISLIGSDEEDSSAGECQHVYDSKIERDPTCIDPGHKVYTCSECGHTFMELLDPLGHVWPIDPSVFAIYKQPQDVTAPVGATAVFSVLATGDDLVYQWSYLGTDGVWYKSPAEGNQTNTLSIPVTKNRDGNKYRCKITDRTGAVLFSNDVTLTVGPAVEPVPYEGLTCSRCGVSGEYNGKDIVSGGWDSLDTDIFDAAGDLIAEGITWLLDKATELVNALTGITDIFNRFVDRIGALIGLYPAFLAAVFVLLPEDLTTVIWFGVIAFVLLAVCKKYNKS